MHVMQTGTNNGERQHIEIERDRERERAKAMKETK